MLTKNQLNEIKEHLNKAQNPIFFFDNDSDGLCAFLILRRYNNRGSGIPIRSFPELTAEYFSKINELNPDYIFILDKPMVSKEFLEEAHKHNIPVVWIDHHEIERDRIPKFVNYYNPFYNKENSNEPTTYLCYSATRKKEDFWIAVLGSISDMYVPEFYEEFLKQYPDLSVESKKASEIFYTSQIGKIIRMFSFGLKDKTTNVNKMLDFLIKVKNPYNILDETKENKTIHSRFNEINKKYKKLIEEAEKTKNAEKTIFFKYGGDLSISSDVSNEIKFRNPDKLVLVGYIKGDRINISGRGDNIKKIVLDSIVGLQDSRGGGHEKAVGAQIRTEDWEEFEKRINKTIDLQKNL